MDHTIAPVHQEDLVRIRRQLHMYPELKWDLPMTAALVKEELDKYGVSYVADQYGPNTIVATINPEKAHFTIGIRADMDALPIQEENGQAGDIGGQVDHFGLGIGGAQTQPGKGRKGHDEEGSRTGAVKSIVNAHRKAADHGCRHDFRRQHQLRFRVVMEDPGVQHNKCRHRQN